MAGKWKKWNSNSTMETIMWHKFWFVLNSQTKKRPYRLNTHPQTSIGSFLWQLEYGYGPLQGLEGLLNNDNTRMLLLQWGWGSLISVQFV